MQLKWSMMKPHAPRWTTDVKTNHKFWDLNKCNEFRRANIHLFPLTSVLENLSWIGSNQYIFHLRWRQHTRQNSTDHGPPWSGSTRSRDHIWPSEECSGWRTPRTWWWWWRRWRQRAWPWAGQLEHGAPWWPSGVYLHRPNYEDRPNHWKR